MPCDPVRSRAGHPGHYIIKTCTVEIMISQRLDDLGALRDVALRKSRKIKQVDQCAFIQRGQALPELLVGHVALIAH